MAGRGRGGHFQFTLVELSALALSFVVTSALVFLLGFYVGRETGRAHLPAAPGVARVPVGKAPVSEAEPLSVTAGMPAPTAPVDQPPGKRDSQVRPSGERRPPTVAAQKAGPTADPLASAGGPAGQSARRPSSTPAVPYTVQVLATRNGREAEALARDLKRRGVGAFVTEVEGDTGRWYRVRIGRYDDLRAAQRMADRCRRELGLTQAYVSAFRNEP